MQMAVIEAARNLVGLRGASSTEFGPCDHPVVGLLPEWTRDDVVARSNDAGGLGGTMRLGAYAANVLPGRMVAGTYGKTAARERKRHRYMVKVHNQRQEQE